MNRTNKIYFEVSKQKLLLRFFDVVFVFAALYLVGEWIDVDYLKVLQSHFYNDILLAIYLISIGAIFEMYDLQIANDEYQVLKSVTLTATVTVLFYILPLFLSPEFSNNRFQMLLFYVTLLSALLVWRIVYLRFLTPNLFLKNALLVGNREQMDELVQGLKISNPHYRIIAYVNLDTSKRDDFGCHFAQHLDIDDLVCFVTNNKLFEIVIAKQKSEDIPVQLYRKLRHLLESGTTIREYTHVYETKTYRIPVHYISHEVCQFSSFNESITNTLYLLYSRIMGILIASMGMFFGALLIPLIALINTFGNRGNLFYTQDRVGENGKIFQILKFRTMVKNAEKTGAEFSMPRDSRVTPFGKFLRKTRIDEIPQFINVLKGDMEVIGPRPERPFFVKEITEIMPFYETRHVIKPGITGWAQVNYSYGESIEDSLIKLQYDLYYIKHRSIFMDFTIIIKTISTVLFYKGQ